MNWVFELLFEMFHKIIIMGILNPLGALVRYRFVKVFNRKVKYSDYYTTEIKGFINVFVAIGFIIGVVLMIKWILEQFS